MSLRLRARGPRGVNKVVAVADGETVGAFLERMATSFENKGGPFELLCGYPPKLVIAGHEDKMDTFIKSGDSVTLRCKAGVASSSSTTANIQKKKRSVPSISNLQGGDFAFYNHGDGVDMVRIVKLHPGPPATPESYTAVVESSEEQSRIGREINIIYQSTKLSLDNEGQLNKKDSRAPPSSKWSCTACTFSNESSAKACTICSTPRADGVSINGGAASLRSANSHQSKSAHRHKIIDDNSCLFHAVAFLLRRSETPAQMRSMIAAAVRSDPGLWCDAILGKTREEYIRFIVDPTKWGGQVELNILCSIVRVELAAVDIQSGRMDIYGQGSGYATRVYLLFSGIHFDAVVFGDRQDTREVQASDSVAQRAVEVLATSLRSQGAFTDQTTMQLVCKTCGHEMSGDYEARLHAGSSGHKDFAMKK